MPVRCDSALDELEDLQVVLSLGNVQRRVSFRFCEVRVRPRLEERLDAASLAFVGRDDKRRHLVRVLGVQVGAPRDEVVEAGKLAVQGGLH